MKINDAEKCPPYSEKDEKYERWSNVMHHLMRWFEHA